MDGHFISEEEERDCGLFLTSRFKIRNDFIVTVMYTRVRQVEKSDFSLNLQIVLANLEQVIGHHRVETPC